MADATPPATPPATPDAVAGPTSPSTAAAGVPIQVVPAENEYKGTLPAKAVHTVTNTSTVKQCIKVKVYDNKMISCKPTCAFLKPGEQVTLSMQHARFEYNPAEQAEYDKRRVGICYAEAPDSATNAMTFQKDVPAASWKMVKLPVIYKLDAAAKAPAGATKSAGGAAKKSASAKQAAATKSTGAALQGTKSATGGAAKKSVGAKKSAAAAAAKDAAAAPAADAAQAADAAPAPAADAQPTPGP